MYFLFFTLLFYSQDPSTEWKCDETVLSIVKHCLAQFNYLFYPALTHTTYVCRVESEIVSYNSGFIVIILSLKMIRQMFSRFDYRLVIHWFSHLLCASSRNLN